MSRLAFLCVLCVLCGPSAFATTLIVDGLGASPEHFATIRGALQALGASGLGTDGVSDEIAITANRLTEFTGFCVNGTAATLEVQSGPTSGESYGPVRDPITFEGDAGGDGQPCVIDITYPNRAYGVPYIAAPLADGQVLVLRDLWLMPTYGTIFTDGQILWVSNGHWPAPLVGAKVTLERVVMTASLPGNVPQDPANSGPRGTGVHELDQDGTMSAFAFDTTPWAGLDLSLRLEDCAIANQYATGMRVLFDTGTVLARRTLINNNGTYLPGLGPLGRGIEIHAAHQASVELDHATVTYSRATGLDFTGRSARDELQAVRVSAGCRFQGNGGAMVIGSFGPWNCSIEGTAGEPVVLDQNGSTFYFDRGGHLAAHQMVVTGGQTRLYRSGEISMSASFDRCLFASTPYYFDSSYDVYRAGTMMILTNLGAVFRRCTFHDVVTRPDEVGTPTLLYTSSLSASADVVLSDCILSGTGDEMAFGTSKVYDLGVHLDHCAVVRQGPNAVMALGVSPEGLITFDHVIEDDPQYVNLDVPPGPSSFDVRSPAYAAAGSDGGPLSGWGDYVGLLPPELVGITVH